MLTLHIGVGRAVHGGDATQRQVVVHHREHTLLHLATVPGVENHLLAAADVEGHAGLTVEAQFLVVLHLGLAGGIDGEARREALQLLLGGFDEHVAHEVGLPGHLHDETHGDAGVLVGTAEGVDHEEFLVAELLLGKVFHLGPHSLAHRMIVVLVLLRGPPDSVLRILVHDDIFVFGRTAGVDAGHHVDSTKFSELTLVVASQAGVHFHFEEFLVRGVVVDSFHAGDAQRFEVFSDFVGHSSFIFLKPIGLIGLTSPIGRIIYCLLSFFYFSLASLMAAWAAARRATGTRKGEQLT